MKEEENTQIALPAKPPKRPPVRIKPDTPRSKATREQPGYLDYYLEWDTFQRALKVALIAGTILAMINHAPQILSEQFSPD